MYIDNLHADPEKVKQLTEKVEALREQYALAEQELRNEKRKVPDGYVLIGPGEKVMPGALCFESYHLYWHSAGNSVGCTIDASGATPFTPRTYKFCNPMRVIPSVPPEDRSSISFP